MIIFINFVLLKYIQMVKKFFISMLGTMAGFWLSLIILVIGGVFIIGALAAKTIMGSSSDLKGDKILYLDLSGSIGERQEQVSVTDLLNMTDGQSDDLSTILSALVLSREDKKIKGLYINCGGSSLGIASRSEIVDELKKFKQSGKFIYAYGDNYEQGDYYIASLADSVFVNPVGSINIHGLSASTVFYKNLLDKLGIDVNVVRVGSFKSAVEPYLRMDMSEESRLQTSVFINNIWNDITQSIAEARNLKDPSEVDSWADSLIFTWAPERYVANHSVSALKYREEVINSLRKVMKIDEDAEMPFITPAEYVESKTVLTDNSSKPHLAVLYAVGEISDKGTDGIIGDKMVSQIKELADDKNVKGLLLRVNSPGGSAFASEQIWKALENFKLSGKPFYVSMGDYAASGGYYISCGADVVYADASTLTGSIGIFGIIPNAHRLLTEKIGLGYQTVESNKNANFPSLFDTPSQEQLSAMQTYVNRGYDTFVSRVAAGRHISVDSVKVIGGGRVWDGKSALNLGLVDKLGSMWSAIGDLTDDLGLSSTDIVCYPKLESTMLETIIKESKKNLEIINETGLTKEEIDAYRKFIVKIQNMNPVQSRMAPIILK